MQKNVFEICEPFRHQIKPKVIPFTTENDRMELFALVLIINVLAIATREYLV